MQMMCDEHDILMDVIWIGVRTVVISQMCRAINLSQYSKWLYHDRFSIVLISIVLEVLLGFSENTAMVWDVSESWQSPST